MTSEPVTYLKTILSYQNIDGLITADGYDMIEKEKIVTNHNQAKVLARLVKEVGTNNYNAGYAEGRAEQAFEDGKKMAEFMKGASQGE
ncbi:hypothetical protein [Lactobacillus crispatus]|uniref:hypothetical protein n=1 Tax=Lactobacillus crispatus TaxID=47770 RepID=UPI00105BB00B|nr:hypothetical protein [Lactobacillus crispatus]TDN33294.1 hypothetical protein CEE74_06070 [Lactobacillus crispatus]